MRGPEMAEDPQEIVLYERVGRVAVVTMNRPRYGNAQNVKMTHALDDAFVRAVGDDEVGAIVLGGAGKHFSGGHDIGTPDRDIHRSFPRRASVAWEHEGRGGAEDLFIREQEVYLGMCRRWRELPKPTVAMVQGACIAGGLMLAWCCDLIVASEDATFADPVVRMGIPGVEFFAHPFALNPRLAKEFLFLGEKMTAERAYQAGMINRIFSREVLRQETLALAEKIAAMPRFGLYLTKKAINQAEDRMGLRDTMDASFALHHVAHSHNSMSSPDHLRGQDPKSMALALTPGVDPKTP